MVIVSGVNPAWSAPRASNRTATALCQHSRSKAVKPTASTDSNSIPRGTRPAVLQLPAAVSGLRMDTRDSTNEDKSFFMRGISSLRLVGDYHNKRRKKGLASGWTSESVFTRCKRNERCLLHCPFCVCPPPRNTLFDNKKKAECINVVEWGRGGDAWPVKQPTPRPERAPPPVLTKHQMDTDRGLYKHGVPGAGR